MIIHPIRQRVSTFYRIILLLLFIVGQGKAQTPFAVSFTAHGSCANTPVSFFPTVSPPADSLRWDFGDGHTASSWNPYHTYTTSGAFTVTVTAYRNSSMATFSETVNLTPFNVKLTLPADTTGCHCEFFDQPGCDRLSITAKATEGNQTYQWYSPHGLMPGWTTPTMFPDSAGYYYLVATQGSCAAYAGVNVKIESNPDRQTSVWYFGHQAAFDFAYYDTWLLPPGPVDTPEGSASIADGTGRLLIATDGQRIYNVNGDDITPEPVSPGLGGESGSTQPALIFPVPGDGTLYYIFTTQQVDATNTSELRYSLYDTKLNNGEGGISQFNQLLALNSTERITANREWLIAHDHGSNIFRTYRISEKGIGNPVISAIGSVHSLSEPQNAQGYMKLGAQNRLAVALSTPGVSNKVEVFDFDSATGKLSNFRTANLQSASGQVYGVELSPMGNKLFATLRLGVNSKLVEFSFTTGGIIPLFQSVDQTGDLGALQVAPDGQIYVAIDGAPYLGVFSPSEDTTQISPISTLQQFALWPGTFSSLGLPNYISATVTVPPPSFTASGFCPGTPTHFTATGTGSSLDKFDWSFGDGNSANDAGSNATHTYDMPGTYTVTLNIYDRCGNASILSQDIYINESPDDPSTTAALCTSSAELDANPGNKPGLSYKWVTSEITKTISVASGGAYTVTITNAAGCKREASFFVMDNRPSVDLGSDMNVCKDASAPTLNAQPGATYSWSVNGVSNGNTSSTQTVNTNVIGVFEYEVHVTDPVTLCFNTDDVVYTVNAQPAEPVVTRNGLTLTSSADTDNQWLKNDVEIPDATSKTYLVVDPGTYAVKVTSVGCTVTSNPVTITDSELTPSITSFFPASGPVGTTVTITGSNFSTTMAANEVKFNGITAIVTNSTSGEIVTAVPATASTGKITVEVAGRTGTSLVNFTVCTGLPKPTISANGSMLTSSSAAGNQWLLNGVIIDGANSSTYNAEHPGSYAIRVTENGCTFVSDPTVITGIEEGNASIVKIYPNPTLASVMVVLDSHVSNAEGALYTITGMKIKDIPFVMKESMMMGEVDMKDHPPGVYLIAVFTQKGKVFSRLEKL